MKQINSDELVELYNWFYCKMDQEHDEALDNAIDAATDLTPAWIPVTERLPQDGQYVLVIVSGRHGNARLDRAIELAEFSTDEGWILEMWPKLENPNITYWMPLPEPPKEG